MNNHTVIQNKSLILKNDTSTKHVIRVDPDDDSSVMYIWVRDISFLDIQKAAQTMFVVEKGDVTFNLSGYWEHAFEHWITRTEPDLSKDELLSLKGFVGEQISNVMPQPNDIAEAMQGGFTKKNS
jgi:hypothetical protein